MRPVAVALVLQMMMLAGCISSPTSASAQTNPVIKSLTPSSGAVNAQVAISGSGFASTGNTLTFTVISLAPGGQMPNAPSVIPNLASDGSSIVFKVLTEWRPACSYTPPGPCPIAYFPTAPGTYAVTVTNENGTSNAMTLTVVP